MELRYIEYAGGTFQSCQSRARAPVPRFGNRPLAAKRPSGEGSGREIAPAAGVNGDGTAAPSPAPSAAHAPLATAKPPAYAAPPEKRADALAAMAEEVVPAAGDYDLLAPHEIRFVPEEAGGPPVDARALFTSGDIADALLAANGQKVADLAPAPRPDAKPAETPAPAHPAAIAGLVASAAASPASAVQPVAATRASEATPAPDAPAGAAVGPAPPPAPAAADDVTAQALARLAERRAREAQRHAEREAERRKRQEALAAERQARLSAEAEHRQVARAAKQERRRTRRAAKEARRRERALAREAAVAAAPAPARSRTRALAANLGAALGLVGALGAATWYFAVEHGRFEREARALAAAAVPPRLPTAGKGAARATAPRVSQTALLSIAAIESAIERKSFQQVVRVQRGDNFFMLLMRSGVPGAEAQLANISLAGVYDVRKMRAGQLITVDFGILGEEHNRFLGVRFDSNFDRTVTIQRQARGDFVATEVKKELTTQILRSNAVIDHSVFQAGLQAGLPPDPVVRMINLFAYDVDFQRDIQKGDTFEMLMELHRDRNGDIVRHGNILYASLTLQGHTIKLYRWQSDDGEVDYFSAKGESSRKALMRTPIDGARLSSGFGYRRHPILGYSKLHQGVDFAAPNGTPIFAAGFGQIERIGWHGGYGNAIIIRHNKEHSTLYAHMSGFAPGMTVGKRVNQGDIIGYVGSTGMSTGPHLHYEVHLGGKAIDPLTLKLPSRQKLAGAELARFQDMVKTIDSRFQVLAKNGATGIGITLAAADQEADTGCINGIRLDPTDKRACD
jgi:murein DD-endopeptidase MepM/ murein hydrolase activator NlpD